jgi:formate dehydrogenase subunit gamma
VTRPTEFVRRFELPTRLVHWSLAVPFLLLLLTGLTNYQPRLKALQWDGFRVFAWLHVLLGFAMVVIAIAVVLALLRTRSLQHDALALTDLTQDDYRWLEQQAMTLTGHRSPAPRVGRFNGGQKLNALVSAAATVGLLATGVLLGVNYIDKRFFTVGFVGVVFPWHTLLSLAIAPVVLGHIYLAALNPATRESLRGITRGVVRRDWAARHHPAWPAPPAEDA